jgi:hypothetical protein
LTHRLQQAIVSLELCKRLEVPNSEKKVVASCGDAISAGEAALWGLHEFGKKQPAGACCTHPTTKNI